MKFLLIGLGFISTHVSLYLSEAGEDVTITYRTLNPVKEEYLALLKGKVNSINVDPLSSDFVSTVKGHDVIVNFVGEISGDERKLKIANVEVPRKLAYMAFDNGKIFVHLSGATSTGETGKNVKEEPDHCANSKASTPFEISKCEGEREIMRAAIERDGNVAILRPSLVYGRYAAHIQFVTMYRLAKAKLIPQIPLEMATVSAWSIGKAVLNLGRKSPKREFLYASECGSVKVSRFFELMARETGGGIRFPVPLSLAKIALPGEIRSLLKYSGTTYDCSKFREVAGDLSFDEEEVKANAKFLRYLDGKRKLIPT